jgi:hypothetical protein
MKKWLLLLVAFSTAFYMACGDGGGEGEGGHGGEGQGPELNPDGTYKLSDSAKQYSTPTPSELFSTIDEYVPNIRFRYYLKINKNSGYDDDRMIALNLGDRLAHLVLAVKAKEKQQFLDLADVAQDLALQINVSDPLISRKDELKRHVTNNEWPEVTKIMDALHEEIVEEVRRKENIGVLAETGAWLSGLDLVAEAISENYVVGATKAFYQPQVINHLINELNGLESYSKDSPVVKNVIAGLKEIAKNSPANEEDTLTKEEVVKLHEITSKLMKEITGGE